MLRLVRADVAPEQTWRPPKPCTRCALCKPERVYTDQSNNAKAICTGGGAQTHNTTITCVWQHNSTQKFLDFLGTLSSTHSSPTS